MFISSTGSGTREDGSARSTATLVFSVTMATQLPQWYDGRMERKTGRERRTEREKGGASSDRNRQHHLSVPESHIPGSVSISKAAADDELIIRLENDKNKDKGTSHKTRPINVSFSVKSRDRRRGRRTDRYDLQQGVGMESNQTLWL